MLDNIFLGVDGLLHSRESREARTRRAAAILETLSSSSIALGASGDSLSLSEQQIVAIARALVRDPSILILDESTSALDVEIRDRLFDECIRRRDAGVAIVFISHRMEELLQIADEITVMRDGETVATLAREDANADQLLQLMAGAALQRALPPTGGRTAESSNRPAIFRAERISLRHGHRVDFELLKGEIVGLAGLEGHGQDDFLATLAGGRPTGEGSISVLTDKGGTTRIRNRLDARRRGVAYLPRNRSRDGIFPTLSVADNFSLPTLEQDSRLGLISARMTRNRLEEARLEMSIRFASANAPITSLSGGNQQKLLLSRWIAASPKVLLLDDPTRGVDVRTKRELQLLLRKWSERGVGIVFVSTELEEFEGLCERVIVFHEGAIVTELRGDDIVAHAIVNAMFGTA